MSQLISTQLQFEFPGQQNPKLNTTLFWRFKSSNPLYTSRSCNNTFHVCIVELAFKLLCFSICCSWKQLQLSPYEGLEIYRIVIYFHQLCFVPEGEGSWSTSLIQFSEYLGKIQLSLLWEIEWKFKTQFKETSNSLGEI